MLFVLYHIYAYFSRPFITGLTRLFVLEILIRVASVIDHSSAVEAGKGPSYIMNDEYIRENGYGGKKRIAVKSKIIKIFPITDKENVYTIDRGIDSHW